MTKKFELDDESAKAIAESLKHIMNDPKERQELEDLYNKLGPLTKVFAKSAKGITKKTMKIYKKRVEAEDEIERLLETI